MNHKLSFYKFEILFYTEITHFKSHDLYIIMLTLIILKVSYHVHPLHKLNVQPL